MPVISPAPSTQRLRALLRDLAAGMQQQMFFWGRDVVHPEGNLFLRTGFAKQSCEQLPGSSLYTLPWQGGAIELHGSQAGWFGPDGGFIYLRPQGRCYHWSRERAPIPGLGGRDGLQSDDPDTVLRFAAPFFDWWLDHEQVVMDHHGWAYRDACFRHFGRLPKSRGWLSPVDSLAWVRQLRDEPESVSRARRFRSPRISRS